MEYYDDCEGEKQLSPRQFHSLGSSERRRNRERVLYSLNETESQMSRSHSQDRSNVVAMGKESDSERVIQDSWQSSFEEPSTCRVPRQSYSFYDQPGSTLNRGGRRVKSKSCSQLASLEKEIEHLYRNYTWCHQCHSTDLAQVKDRSGEILMVECRYCSHSFGVDDTMSADVLLDLYRKGCIEVHVGCCANTDPDQFQIQGFDGPNVLVRCMNSKCGKISTLGEKGPENPHRDCQETLVCKCGNKGEMTVRFLGEEIYSVTCNLCGEKVQLPESRPCGRADGDMHNPAEFISCKCRPQDKKIVITKDASGEPEIIACETCQEYFLPKDPIKKESNKKYQRTQGKGTLRSGYKNLSIKRQSQLKYRDVEQITDLRRGDHIAWDRHEGYVHHAIVEHVHRKRTRISVVHYNGPSPSDSKTKGEIIAEELDPFMKDSGRLYVVDYSESLPTEEVIRKAYSRLGEVQYSLFSNNCEHFAIWCKTGQHVSTQVNAVKDCFLKYAKAAPKLPLVGKSAKMLGRHGAVAVMAGCEIISCVKDIANATEDRSAGRLSRDAYVECVVSRTFQGLGGLAGMALGMLVPIPLVGEFIGGTLGGVIGEFAGKMVGKLVVRGCQELQRAYGAKSS